MSALSVRRAAWMLLLSGVFSLGSLFGSVFSQDNAAENKAVKSAPADKEEKSDKPETENGAETSELKSAGRELKAPPVLSAEIEAPDFPEDEKQGNASLQAVGGLGIGHIQSTLGLIGVTADAFAKDVYDAKKVEGLMTSTINGIDVVKKPLRRLQDDKRLSADDEDFIDRMIVAYSALQREAKALTVYAKSKKAADAEAFAKARRIALEKIDNLTGTDETNGPSGTSIDTPVDRPTSRDASDR